MGSLIAHTPNRRTRDVGNAGHTHERIYIYPQPSKIQSEYAEEQRDIREAHINVESRYRATTSTNTLREHDEIL